VCDCDDEADSIVIMR